MIRNITVYCSSSSKVAEVYKSSAADLGRAIAERGWGLVYGGNRIGMMGILADAVRAGGGKVVGITPQFFIDQGYGDNECDELVISTGMRDRKAIMEQRGDALVALPGGLGTLEEIFEVIVARNLGQHRKPIVLLNIAGYYQPLLAMIEGGIEQHFIKPGARGAYFVAASVDQAMEYLNRYSPPPPREPMANSSAAE